MLNPLRIAAHGIERRPITSRDEWLAWRQQYLCASDIPPVCGEGLFGSAAKVWAEKKGLIGQQDQTEAMKRGLWGEAAVFEALSWECRDWEIRRARVFLIDTEARLAATPDGVALAPGHEGLVIVQAKVVAAPVFRRDWMADPQDDVAHGNFEPPMAYQLQTLTEAMLADASCAVLAVLVVDTYKWTLRLYWIQRHAAAEARIRGKVAAFWRDYLDPGIQPPIEPARDAELIKVLYPTEDGTTIDLSADNRAHELVADRERLKYAIAESKETCDAVETEIRAKLGHHTFGRLNDGRLVSLKTVHRKAYQVAASSYRALRVRSA